MKRKSVGREHGAHEIRMKTHVFFSTLGTDN